MSGFKRTRWMHFSCSIARNKCELSTETYLRSSLKRETYDQVWRMAAALGARSWLPPPILPLPWEVWCWRGQRWNQQWAQGVTPKLHAFSCKWPVLSTQATWVWEVALCHCMSPSPGALLLGFGSWLVHILTVWTWTRYSMSSAWYSRKRIQLDIVMVSHSGCTIY